ncbi:unnamed protein product [Protopolystoma xenopodis]|uniref:Uncharacterized protein n=1 Tax=Protopolystoma xenopodis TaxID=117903 RepID=A0A3S5BDV0_9PLAT|nr:unnamed protein product [Protopolystoma xenopodis]
MKARKHVFAFLASNCMKPEQREPCLGGTCKASDKHAHSHAHSTEGEWRMESTQSSTTGTVVPMRLSTLSVYLIVPHFHIHLFIYAFNHPSNGTGRDLVGHFVAERLQLETCRPDPNAQVARKRRPHDPPRPLTSILAQFTPPTAGRSASRTL